MRCGRRERPASWFDPSGDARCLDLRRADGWPSLCCGMSASVPLHGSGASPLSFPEYELTDNYSDTDPADAFVFKFHTVDEELGPDQRWSTWLDVERGSRGPDPRPDWVVTEQA